MGQTIPETQATQTPSTAIPTTDNVVSTAEKTLLTTGVQPTGVQPAAQAAQAGANGQTTGSAANTEAGATGKETDTAETENSADPLAQVPESPEAYALTFAEDTAVDTALLGMFRTTAHELGLKQGQAQKLAEVYAGHVAAQEQKQAASLKQAVQGWEADITSQPGFEAQKSDAQRALAAYGSPELFQIMDDTLIGSHPAMFNFMAKIGKALAEPELKGKSADGSSTDMAKLLYPNHN